MPLYNREAEIIGEVDLSDKVFAVPMNRDLLFQISTSLLANQRQVIAHAKGRSEVRGGGKKPWRQKGTGRARHGSIRSPIWKGGGVTHGPSKERIFAKKINRKMARKALAIAFSAKARDKQLFVVEDIILELPKTREAAHVFKMFSAVLPGYVSTKNRSSSILLVVPSHLEAKPIFRAIRNIPHIDIISANDVNALSLLASKYAIVFKSAVSVIEKMQKNSKSKSGSVNA